MADIGYPITITLAYRYQGTTRTHPLSTQPSANIGYPISIHPPALHYPLPPTEVGHLWPSMPRTCSGSTPNFSTQSSHVSAGGVCTGSACVLSPAFSSSG